MYSNVTALAYFGVELFIASCIFPVAKLVFYLAYHIISNRIANVNLPFTAFD